MADTGEHAIQRAGNGGLVRTILQAVAVLATSLVIGGGVATAVFYAKADGRALEAKIVEAEKSETYRDTLQDGLNTRFDQTLIEVSKQLHRIELRQVQMEARIVPYSKRLPIPPP